jgi:hypothetical protein
MNCIQNMCMIYNTKGNQARISGVFWEQIRSDILLVVCRMPFIDRRIIYHDELHMHVIHKHVRRERDGKQTR